jgi:hypothetical protein
MPDFTVVDIFTHKDRLCVVVQIKGHQNYARIFLENALGTGDYCTGYVQTTKAEGKNYNDYIGEIKADELTFSGKLDYLKDKRIPSELWFFGFDSAHSWNFENPESQTVESVKERTVKLADEMAEKGF